MKKFLVMLIGLLMVPMGVFALDKKYNTLNLDEALTQEEIEHDFSNYKETDDQVIIYLFRGNGCGYCRNFLTFLNSIIDEYGKYFRVVSFEVWSDSSNSALMKEVSNFMEANASGVPFIIIGDQFFPGYNDTYADAVKEAIKTEYDKKDRYDVFDEMDKAAKKGEINYFLIIFCNLLFVISATAIVLAFVNSKHNELLDEIDLIKEHLNIEDTKKEVTDIEEVKETKKAKKDTK